MDSILWRQGLPILPLSESSSSCESASSPVVLFFYRLVMGPSTWWRACERTTFRLVSVNEGFNFAPEGSHVHDQVGWWLAWHRGRQGDLSCESEVFWRRDKTCGMQTASSLHLLSQFFEEQEVTKPWILNIPSTCLTGSVQARLRFCYLMVSKAMAQQSRWLRIQHRHHMMQIACSTHRNHMQIFSRTNTARIPRHTAFPYH